MRSSGSALVVPTWTEKAETLNPRCTGKGASRSRPGPPTCERHERADTWLRIIAAIGTLGMPPTRAQSMARPDDRRRRADGVAACGPRQRRGRTERHDAGRIQRLDRVAAGVRPARSRYLVTEVVASSLAYHKGLKARLYARHRVREFWVIDANESTTWVHTGPSGDGWSSVVKCGPQDALTSSALTGFSIRLGEIE